MRSLIVKFLKKTLGGRCFIAKFTLIELLLVVSIMLILASLLFPALHSAREKSKTIACAGGNLKQVLSAGLLYAGDHNGNLFMVSTAGDGTTPFSTVLFNGNYIPSGSSVIYCPSAPLPDFNCWFTYGGNFTPLAYTLPVPAGFVNYVCHSLYRCTTPSTDTLLGDTTVRITHASFPNQYYRYYLTWLSASGGIFLRHSGGIANMAFIDGHVEGCNDKRLKNIGITAYIDKNYNEFY